MFGRSHREELRAQVSSEMGAYTKPGSLGGPDSSFSPSSITGRFLTILRVRDLMNLANYDDELVRCLAHVSACVLAKRLIWRTDPFYEGNSHSRHDGVSYGSGSANQVFDRR